MFTPDNKFIQDMILASGAILEAVPQLRTISARIRELQRECSGCSGNQNAQNELDAQFNDLRAFLLTLPEPSRKLIRDRVSGGQRMRIAYRTGQGANTKLKSGDL